MDRFSNSALAFECDIPEGWQSLPSPWVKQFRLSASSTSEQLADVLDKAESPFLCMYLPQQDPTVSIPSVQCTVKAASVVNQLGGLAGALDAVLPQMEAAFPDLQIIQRSDAYLVAGSVGAYLKTSMTVLNSNKEKSFCISELVLIRTNRFLFVVGLTGPADELQRPGKDFNDIIRSIRVNP